MRLSALHEHIVGILGMGAEGQSVFRALRRTGYDGTVVALADDRGDFEARGLRWRFGMNQRQGVAEVSLVVRSPGFPLHHPTLQEIRRRGIRMTTATNLFLSEVRAAGLPIIGVTGSKGKSTTSTLIWRALQRAGRPTSLVGNIGRPALDQLDDVLQRRAVSVFELSSYQCHDLILSPSVAVLLDLFPEHMDWHGSVEAYYDAKLNIARHQRPGDRFIFNDASRIWSAPLGEGALQAVNRDGGLRFSEGNFYRGDDRLFSDDGVSLLGVHQRRNMVSAIAAVEAVGVDASAVLDAAQGFTGLPHRNQDLGEAGGVRWFDDAISTAPQAAVAALAALDGTAHTLIVGGLDRGYDFTPLADAIRGGAAKVVLTVPDSAGALVKQLSESRVVVETLASLEAAVARAAVLTPPGKAVVFSPASPSYNRFRSFRERGQRFQELVQALRA
ncbi:MAG: UDP-N-acetylmuramoyl-L-alanine--D-glutamate ligase [Myxococcota bacterium]